MKLRLPIAAAMLLAGVVMLYFGIQERNSFGSEVSELVTGSPTDQAMWLLVGGAALAAFGAFLGLTGQGS